MTDAPTPAPGTKKSDADLIAEERAFLHSMATPLATISLLLESMIENAEGAPADSPLAAEAKRLQQLFGLIGRVNNLLRDRRSSLIARLNEGKPTVQS